MEKYRDKGGSFEAILTDLPKAFDCLLHDLLFAKIHAYVFYMASLKLIYTYLSGRNKRVKINDKYTTWEEILFGVPQGSILGPLLFNNFVCYLFLFTNDIDIANYADDNTTYATLSKTNLVIEKIEQCSDSLFTWFQNNGMKATADKCHFLVSAKVCSINNFANSNKFKIKINEINIESSLHEKLLGVILDDQLNFKCHKSNLCKKTSQKLNALARISSFMDLPKRRIIISAYSNSQFGY